MNWLAAVRRFFDIRAMLPDGMEPLAPLPSGRETYGRYIELAVPSVCEMVLISLISMMDTVMVSGVGTDAVAAVGLVGQPRMIMLCIFFALNVGITAVVARRRGEERREAANATVRTAVVLCVAFSALLVALMVPLAEPLMRFAGAEEGRTLAESTEYFTILAFAMPFQALSMAMCAAQRGVGNTRLTMVVNITSNLVNICFNWLLINGIGPFPRLGVRGAAIATAIGLAVGFVLSLAAMLRSKGSSFLHLSLRDSWIPDRESMQALYKVASSAMVEQLAMRVGFFSYAKIVASLGTDAFAAHQICLQFMNLSFSCADGLGVAGTSLVGQMLGSKRRDLAHIYGTVAQRFSLVISLLLAAACILLRAPLVSMFIRGGDSENVREMAQHVMVVLGLIQPLQMLAVVSSGALRGAGDVRYTARIMLLTVTVIRPVLAFTGVYIAGTLLHQQEIALLCAWSATLCDMTVRTTLMLKRYRSGGWHSIRV
ncbi:MAG: MATE family efflux transporter [Clostridia bacterium]|nr:MATE family efflux transporter [Clostridia bacterium]